MSHAASIDVLLVDDEPDFAELVAEQLKAGDSRLAVHVETDARNAINRLDAHEIDCVVSDYEMPDIDGLDLLKTVRSSYPDLPFILFTGKGSETIASEAISAGVTEYMQKGTDPQQFDVLANRVRNAVARYQTERELERTETRYRRLVEQNLTGIYIIQEGDIMYANPKCEEIFGYTQDELLTMSAFDIVAEEDHALLENSIKARETGDVEEMNYTLTGIRKDGERFEFEVHSGRIDYEGDPAILGSLIDVTEQRERERELEEYRELVETVGDPMYVLDETGHVVKVNGAMADLLGYTREELLNSHASQFLTESAQAAGMTVIQDAVAGDLDPPQTFEFDFITKAGEYVPCEANVTTLSDDEGNFRGSVGVVRVIKERKERERELEEYETIVETAPDGIFILGPDGTFRNGNKTGAEMIGMELDELIGEEYLKLVEEGILKERVVERYLEVVKDLLSDDTGRDKAKFEATITPPDSESRECEIHIALLPYEDQFRGAVGVIRDITERKEIEMALRTERDRLSSLFENIPEATLDYEFEDGEPIILQVNDAFEETFGFSEAELLGESLDDYIVPPDTYEEAEELNERVVTGEQLDVEIQRKTADGEIRDFLLRNAPIPAENGSIQGYAIYTDITERKQSEERINALFEFSTDCIVETEYVDGQPVVQRVNDAFEETFGYDESELVDRNLDEFVIPDVVDDEIAREINEQVAAGDPVEREVTRQTARGPRDFLLRAIPFDVRGAGNWTYAVYTDITDRKRRERRLSALHEATRNLMEATSQSEVIEIGIDAAESVLGLNVAAVFGPTDDHRVLKPLASTKGARDLFETLPRMKRGDSLAWEVFESGDPLVAEDIREYEAVYNPETPARSEMIIPMGEFGVFLAASTEVGAFSEADRTLAKVLLSNVEAALDRAQRETVLRERERRLSALHEATRDLMDAARQSEVVEIGLDAAESVLGLQVAAFYGLDESGSVLEPLAATAGARELFDGMPAFEEDDGILWESFRSGQPLVTDDYREKGVLYDPTTSVRSEMVIPIADHGVFMAASRSVGAFDDADRTLAKVLVSNVESALDRAQRETLLREREQALLRQNERLEEFAGVVSHDLRSPLTVAKGNAYLLRQKDDEKYLEKLEKSLDRMEQLIDDLLTLARQGETVDEPETIEPADVAEDAWQNVDTAGAQLEVDSSRSILADPNRFQQLLENLFRNAVEHGGRTVTITVGVTDDGFYVEDDGTGVPPEKQNKLFEAGFTTDEEGTGFGLSIVKQIAEAHGWDVDVTDGTDGGARFEFHNVEMSEVLEQ